MMIAAADAISHGRQARKVGNLPLARAHYAEAAWIYRDEGETLAYALCIRHVADIFRHESNLAAAKPLYEEALEIYRNHLDTKLLDLANTVRPYALLQEDLGDHDRAMPLWTEARNLYSSLRIEAGVAECEKHLHKLHA